MLLAIKHLYPAAVAERDFRLRDDSDSRGTYVEFWDTLVLGPQPTKEVLQAAEIVANDAAIAAATKEAQDIAAARTYAKLIALKNMSPAQVQAWVAANVTNLAQAQDAIATLAIAVSILARKL